MVGTSNEVPNLLELCESGKTIGDLGVEQQMRVFDPNSKDRYSNLLDVLCRLQLIELRVTQVGLADFVGYK